jgi:hypothetical protein
VQAGGDQTMRPIRARPLAKKTASLIGKETDERRTSNIERPTSNNEFYQFKKRLSEATSTIRQLSFVIP